MRHAIIRVGLRWFALLLTTLLWAFGTAAAPTLVKVGGYEFPPFVDGNRGVTLDLINLLNEAQGEYRFVFQPTSPRWRYQDFDQGAFDVMFFESLSWGWKDKPVESSQVYLRGDGEVYVALAAPGRDERFFDRPAAHSLVVVSGYHYGFADFVSDRNSLRKRFNITFAETPEAMLRMLMARRAEIAVVTRSYLYAFLQRDPQLQPRLLVSERFDQLYAHTALARLGGPVSAATLDTLIKNLERSGRLQELWSRYGISEGGK